MALWEFFWPAKGWQFLKNVSAWLLQSKQFWNAPHSGYCLLLAKGVRLVRFKRIVVSIYKNYNKHPVHGYRITVMVMKRCTAHQTLFGWWNPDEQVGRVYGTFERDARSLQGLGGGELKEREHLEELDVKGRIILKCIFKKCDREGRTELLWIGIGTGGGH